VDEVFTCVVQFFWQNQTKRPLISFFWKFSIENCFKVHFLCEKTQKWKLQFYFSWKKIKHTKPLVSIFKRINNQKNIQSNSMLLKIFKELRISIKRTSKEMMVWCRFLDLFICYSKTLVDATTCFMTFRIISQGLEPCFWFF
jgi:hypothetical protein